VGEIRGEIVKIGNASNRPKEADSGRFFRFLQSVFPVWGKASVSEPKKEPQWRRKTVADNGIRVP
jgi:hypothetical protein